MEKPLIEDHFFFRFQGQNNIFTMYYIKLIIVNSNEMQIHYYTA